MAMLLFCRFTVTPGDFSNTSKAEPPASVMLFLTLITIRSIFCSNMGFLAATVTSFNFKSKLFNRRIGEFISFLSELISNIFENTWLIPVKVAVRRYLPFLIFVNEYLPDASDIIPLTREESEIFSNNTLAY